MTTPSEPDNGAPGEGVNLGKADPKSGQTRGQTGGRSSDPTSDAPFDPYRFGKPDHPIPAEYAPPGYTGPVIPPAPYGQPGPWAPQGPGQQHNPFGTQPSPYGYPSQPPGPYGPPPPHHGYVQPKPGNGKAIAALVLGIASIVFSFLSFFDVVFVALGLIFSLIALTETRAPGTSGRGMAIAGLICALVGAALATLFSVLVIHAANQCGGFSNSNDPGFNSCVRHHLG